MCVIILFATFVWNISDSTNWARCGQQYILLSMYSTFYCCPILMKIEFFDRFSENPQI
jgi:hypothetical protein